MCTLGNIISVKDWRWLLLIHKLFASQTVFIVLLLWIILRDATQFCLCSEHVRTQSYDLKWLALQYSRLHSFGSTDLNEVLECQNISFESLWTKEYFLNQSIMIWIKCASGVPPVRIQVWSSSLPMNRHKNMMFYVLIFKLKFELHHTLLKPLFCHL